MAIRLTPNSSIYKILLLAALLVILLSFNLDAQKPTAKTFFDLGIQHSRNAEYSEALDAFKHAIKLKPDYAEAYYNLGHIYFSLHRYTEAAEAYKQAVIIKPKYVEPYISFAIIGYINILDSLNNIWLYEKSAISNS